MNNLKEIRSIELSSFTIMTTLIALLFSVISAIVLSVLIGLMAPNGASVIIYLVPTVIVGSFMFVIYSSFSEGLFYNILAKKLKTIVIDIKDNEEIVKISTTETAMMISIITTIEVILLYLSTSLILPLFLTTLMQTLLYSGQQIIAYNIYQLMVLISQPTTIAMILFGTFIISFVFVLLGTYIYNFLGKTGRGINLKLSNENGFTGIDSIDALKLSIAFAIIVGILNLIIAIIMIVSGGSITTAIGNILVGFVGSFIEAYLIAVFYNYLAPKIGKIKIELIDFKIN